MKVGNTIFQMYLLLLACLMLVLPSAGSPPTWSDEFNGAGPVDPAVWTYENGFARNEELQWYTSANAWMEDGMLIMEGRRETVPNPNFTSTGDSDWKKNREFAYYTSASIVSTGKFYWQYGRAQIRAKIPARVGMWPAIWGCGQVGQWPHNGECDILEFYGDKILANCAVGSTNAWQANWFSSNKAVPTFEAVESDWRTSYHVWTIQWDQDYVRLYVDNVLLKAVAQTSLKNADGYNASWGPQYPFKQPFSIWLNLAIGGAGGDPSGTPFPQRYYVDYWRVWEGATNNVAPTDIALSANSVTEGLPVGTFIGDLSAADTDVAEVLRYSLVTGAGDTNNSQFEAQEFVSDNTTMSVLKTKEVLNYDDGATRSIRVRVTDIEGATYDKVFAINVIPAPAVVVSSNGMNVAEGSTTSFQAQLRVLPAGTVTVNVSRASGDADLSVSSGSQLTFTTGNWSIWQTVTIAAAEDADWSNGSAMFVCEAPGQISATVTVVEADNDNLPPVVDAGTNQTVLIGAGAAWTPAHTNTAAWFDAKDAGTVIESGGLVSQWSDKSGNDRHIVQDVGTNKPSYSATAWDGSLPALTFDGVSDYLENAVQQSQGTVTMAVVMDQANLDNQSRPFGIRGSTSSGKNSLAFACDNSLRYDGAYAAKIITATVGKHLRVATRTVSNQTDFHDGSANINSATALPNVDGFINAGNTMSTLAGFFSSKMAEGVIMYQDIDTSTREKIEGYLAHKWGLATQLPAGHTYKTNPPQDTAAVATLNAVVSDPNGDSPATLWAVTSGPAGTVFSDATATNTTATFVHAGTYTLRLTADDGLLQSYDEVVINVSTGGVSSFAVTYNGNGGTGGSVPVDGSSPYTNGAPVTVLGNTGTLVRTGYAFNNWNTAANGGGTAYSGGNTFSMPASNVTLYAQWAGNSYTVTFNANGGGTPSPTSKSVAYAATYSTLATVSRPFYIFTGWFTAASGGSQITDSTLVATAANHTLYAQWYGGMVDPKTPTNALPLTGGAYWSLAFSDEFNTNSLDTTKWGIDVSATSRGSRSERGVADWWWKSSNVSLDGSNLVLAVTKQDSNTMWCGSVSSDGLYEATYGYMEARIQIADTTKDTHTAFWMQSENMGNVDGTANDGAEIDIFESPYFADQASCSVHIDGYSTNHVSKGGSWSAPGIHSGYHTFGLDWSPRSMRVYYDGVLKYTYTGTWVVQTNEYIWLSDGCSFADIGTFTNEPNGLLTSAKFDYVRVWQTANYPPVFPSDPVERPTAFAGVTYSNSIAAAAEDEDNDSLTYSKEFGPAWLNILSNGTLTGLPTGSNLGTNSWSVRVTDTEGASDTATLQVVVMNPGDPVVLVGGSLLNGNFNANPGVSVTFDATEAWYNTKSDQGQVATRSDVAYDGTQNGTLTSIRGFGVDTEYSLVAGDSFDFSYVWKDDWNWVDASDQVSVSLFVTSDNTITGTRTNLVVDYSGLRQVNDAYESIVRTGIYTVSASVAGQRLFAAIEVTSAGFARIDNFELKVRSYVAVTNLNVLYQGNGSSGGSVPVDSNSYSNGSTVTVLGNTGTLVRTGYAFNGWNTATNGSGTAYSGGGTFSMPSSNVTLFAQWTPNTYAVTYNDNGATSGTAPSSQTKTNDVSLTLATNSGNLACTGYTFSGWNTATNGTGTDYAAGSSYTANAALALYAKWVAGASGTWIQTAAGPYDWGTASNWTANTIPEGSDNTAYFTTNITAAQIVNLESDRTIGNITFTDSTTASHNLTISGANILTLSRSSGIPVIDVTQSGRTLAISNAISGGNGLQKNGLGILVLSGTNTYAGGTTINAGQVNITADSNLGVTAGGVTFSGNATLNGVNSPTLNTNRTITINGGTVATINANGSGLLIVNGALTGSGALVSSGTHGLHFMNPDNTFTGSITNGTGGATTYGFGMASISDVAGVGCINLGMATSPGTFRWLGSYGSTKTLANRQFALSGTTGGGVISALGTTASDNLVITRDLLVTGTGNKTLTLAGVNIGDNTFAGVIPVSAGAMISLAKSEAGKWIVSGNNTATGTVSVAAGRLVLTGTNQFTGAITVNSAGGGIYGTLAFNSISNYGVASALGKGTAGAAIRLGNGTASPGALEYTGAGDSTDRIIKIGNNSSAGGAIYNNGSGPLIFTAAAFNEAGTGGAAPLTLGGSYGGVNEIQGIITNNTASAVSITKANDASIWALSGTNTYSGTTSVSGGKLFINGDQSGATGNVSVAASATLGGGGTVGGNVTVAANGRLEFDISTVPGSHNPLDLTAGRVLTFSGASVLTIATSGNASTGSYTLVTGGTNIVGSAPATVNLPAGWEGNISISGNSLLLNVTAISEGSCNLTVTSAYGTPSPAGVTVQASNSVVNAYIGGSPVTLGSIQYVATGWIGTGSAVSGTGTNTSFTITQDSTISWLWQTNYYITFGVEGE